MIDIELEKAFARVVRWMSRIQGQTVDIQTLVFLIGVRELGQGQREFTKNEKIEVMHISICRLLMPFGYYKLVGLDQDGWPHYEVDEVLPELTSGEQERLMKEAIVQYVKDENIDLD